MTLVVVEISKESCIKAVLRLYQGSIKALLTYALTVAVVEINNGYFAMALPTRTSPPVVKALLRLT